MIKLLAAILALSSFAIVLGGPLHTSDRWIMDENNQRVKLRCVNWAGHLEVNIPEGLHHQSIDTITSWIAANNFNCVRLTYSIDMALNPQQSVADAFNAAAGPAGVSQTDMQGLYERAVANNPFLSSATTLGTFAAVIDALGSKGINVILDNHVSKAGWCCNLTDGNGWWDAAPGFNALNSQFFNTGNWLNGLAAMATFARDHPAVVGMSLRNELRAILLQLVNEADAWANFVTQGAQTIHAVHPDLLIIIGGVDSAANSRSMFSSPLDTSAWGLNRTVWEFHAYSFTVTFPNPLGICAIVDALYGFNAGFLLTQNQPYTGPLWLSEFGVGMTGGPNQGLSDADSKYLSCLVQYMEGNDADWAVWALQGSYYVRNQMVDFDESFGLLTGDWSAWRNPAFPGMLGGMWNVNQRP